MSTFIFRISFALAVALPLLALTTQLPAHAQSSDSLLFLVRDDVGPALVLPPPPPPPAPSAQSLPLPPPVQPEVTVQPPAGVPPGFSTAIPTDVTRFDRPPAPPLAAVASLAVRPGAYVFSSNSCMCLGNRLHDLAVSALRGSLYSVEGERQLRLARGRMLVMTGMERAEIAAGTTLARVNPGSSAIVETGSNGIVRVYGLSAPAAGGAAVSVSFDGADSKAMPLSAGQELVVASADLSEEELIPVDGIERRPVEGSVALALPGNVRMSEFSVRQMAAYDALLNCRESTVQGPPSLRRLVRDAREQLASAVEAQGRFEGAAASVSTRVSATIIGGSAKRQDGPITEALPATLTYNPVVSGTSQLVLARAEAVRL